MRKKTAKGFTLLEMIVVVVIIAVLAAVAVPMVEVSVKREKEIELRRSLRTIRTAIDDFKKFVEDNNIKMDEDTYNYPEELEDLVKGIEYKDEKAEEQIKKFLRSLPFDPMTNSDEWGMRSYQDKRDENSWGGENVWDVYTKSERKALDGSYYKDW
jgi:general secretion pathway protein G